MAVTATINILLWLMSVSCTDRMVVRIVQWRHGTNNLLEVAVLATINILLWLMSVSCTDTCIMIVKNCTVADMVITIY